ncbi:MAG: NAD(P)H-dependent oxidoreductase subunit E, partial [Tissierellia bacterium]|nr:NAD(P)H-dependent oxidoreductase subunit E [Tissierellia bacterium]
GLAPVITINDKVYGKVTPEKTVEIINKIKEEETNGN